MIPLTRRNLLLGSVAVLGSPTLRAEDRAADHVTESLRGKVVWTTDALKKQFGVASDPEAAHESVSLLTADGTLHPIIREARGRGFWKDARLRDRQMELLVRRYNGSPFVQVIRVYTIKDGRKYELDYWCDICAIIMYELKECECCQGPIRLREQLVEEHETK